MIYKLKKFTGAELMAALDMALELSMDDVPYPLEKLVAEIRNRLVNANEKSPYQMLYESNSKIAAIKAYRERENVALKVAKEQIEELAAKGGWVRADGSALDVFPEPEGSYP